MPLIQPPRGIELAALRYGGGGERTRLICGFIGCEVPENPLLRLLPALLTLQVVRGSWFDLSFRRTLREAAGQR
ncbi:MAG TPA: AraC family transcriptional regulator, partial [Pseudomonas sp.]|nr:AraC family transcriptional regulator [Pseudomonas sp.]